MWANIGVRQSYTGQTENGSFDKLLEKDIHSHFIGDQLMTDRLFILSVEEALKYKQYLWRFGEAMDTGDAENPDSQINAFCKGYWLRSSMGNGDGSTDEAVYVVDMVDGTVRPQAIEAESSSIGVRPAFALAQED